MLETLIDNIDFEAISTTLVAYIPKLAAALLIIALFWLGSVILRKAVTTGLKRSHVPEDARSLLLRFIKYAVGAIGLLMVIDQLGFDITSLIAGLGVAGLALSFAAQDTISNLISGVAILVDRPFKKGDWISLDDMHATVTDIRLRTSVLTTFDNETVVVPNKSLTQTRIVNYTQTPRIRVRVPVGVAYKEDTEAARKVMLSTLEGDSRIMDDPAPVVLVSSLEDSSVNLELRFWTEDAIMKFPLMWEYTEKCKHALDDADIEIPFPHMQLFLEKTAGLSELAGDREE
ncbi:MAG: mechanosensitive ion channel family protein [Lentisphaeria bacterium]